MTCEVPPPETGRLRLIPKSNSIFYFDFFVFTHGHIKANQMSRQFLSPFSPPPKWGRVRVGVKLIPKSNSILNLYFFVFTYRHIEPDLMGAQLFIGMGI